jgi:hypothetical protein
MMSLPEGRFSGKDISSTAVWPSLPVFRSGKAEAGFDKHVFHVEVFRERGCFLKSLQLGWEVRPGKSRGTSLGLVLMLVDSVNLLQAANHP